MRKVLHIASILEHTVSKNTNIVECVQGTEHSQNTCMQRTLNARELEIIIGSADFILHNVGFGRGAIERLSWPSWLPEVCLCANERFIR